MGCGHPADVMEEIFRAVCEVRMRNSHTPISQSEKGANNRFRITQLLLVYIKQVNREHIFLCPKLTGAPCQVLLIVKVSEFNLTNFNISLQGS